MSRLTHQAKAYLAAMRMTRTQLIVFIEGKENDPVFYSQVCERYGSSLGISVEVRRAQELPGAAESKVGGSGGKAWLIKFGNYWSDHTSRSSVNYKCKVLIALDKDVDEVHSTRRTGGLFIFTEGYAVENYLIAGTDLVGTVGAGFSLMPTELRAIIGSDQRRWMNQAVTRWYDWIVFCIMVKSYRVLSIRSYSNPSAFNRPRHSDVDTVLRDQAFTDLQQSTGVSESEFAFVRVEVEKFVAAKFAAGEDDALFKGEWYIDILLSQIEADRRLYSQCVQIGKNGMWAAVRASFHLLDSMYEHYRVAFDNALAAN